MKKFGARKKYLKISELALEGCLFTDLHFITWLLEIFIK